MKPGWVVVAQILVTILLAAFASYGGVRAGQAQSTAKSEALQERADLQQAQMNRMEDNINWLVRHEIEKADRASGRTK